jgi:hypothetical protein
MTLHRILLDQRGVALPMAMIVLTLMTTLMVAFAVLSQSEPVVASNQLRVAQARLNAEAGLERAVWALNQGVVNPGVAGSLAFPLPAPVPAPYDGSLFVALGARGGFTVTVAAVAGQPNERQITATGWTPTNDVNDARTKAHRTVRAVVERLPDFAGNSFCALCVRGDVSVGGNALVDATLDTSCGNKKGVGAAGGLSIGGSAEVKGADGNSTANESTDYQDHITDPAAFDGVTFSARNLDTLRALAKANGTYFGPGYPNGTPASSPAWSGSVTFNSSNQLKNGVVFVDTVSGGNIPTDVSAQDAADFASVSIHGNPFVSGDFSGWIIVNGSLAISGNMRINGLVYTVNDFTYNGTGTGEIRGLAISQNVRDVTATSISSTDSETTGNSRIKFNCANTRSPSGVPQGFTLQAGTYRELAD